MSDETESRTRGAGLAATLAELQVGECHSKIQPISNTHTLAEIRDNIPEWRTRFRNNLAPAVKRARDRTGGEYSLQVCDVMTNDFNLHLVAIITRTA